jgi:hypothetical protein
LPCIQAELGTCTKRPSTRIATHLGSAVLVHMLHPTPELTCMPAWPPLHPCRQLQQSLLHGS